MSLNGRVYHEDMWAWQIYHDKFKRIPRKLKKLFKKNSNESVKMQMCKWLRDRDAKRERNKQIQLYGNY